MSASFFFICPSCGCIIWLLTNLSQSLFILHSFGVLVDFFKNLHIVNIIFWGIQFCGFLERGRVIYKTKVPNRIVPSPPNSHTLFFVVSQPQAIPGLFSIPKVLHFICYINEIIQDAAFWVWQGSPRKIHLKYIQVLLFRIYNILF